MNAEEAAEVERIVKVRNWFVRPLFITTIGVTLISNLSVAEPTWMSWLSHGWAPVGYLFAVELIVLGIVSGGWAWFVNAFVGVVAAVSFGVSFAYLRSAALDAGWNTETAWAFPVLVDAFALALTGAMKGSQVKAEHIEAMARDREYHEAMAAREAEQAPSKGGRPRSATSKRAVRELERAAESVRAIEPARTEPERTDAPDAAVLQVYALCGDDPNAWPGPTAYAQTAGISKSTAQGHLKRARSYAETRTRTAEQARTEPEQVPATS